MTGEYDHCILKVTVPGHTCKHEKEEKNANYQRVKKEDQTEIASPVAVGSHDLSADLIVANQQVANVGVTSEQIKMILGYIVDLILTYGNFA